MGVDAVDFTFKILGVIASLAIVAKAIDHWVYKRHKKPLELAVHRRAEIQYRLTLVKDLVRAEAVLASTEPVSAEDRAVAVETVRFISPLKKEWEQAEAERVTKEKKKREAEQAKAARKPWWRQWMAWVPGKQGQAPRDDVVAAEEGRNSVGSFGQYRVEVEGVTASEPEETSASGSSLAVPQQPTRRAFSGSREA